MSLKTVKRYDPEVIQNYPIMEENPEGEYVTYADYENLLQMYELVCNEIGAIKDQLEGC